MKRLIASLLLLFANACGGGSSSSDGLLIEGTLSQGSTVVHTGLRALLKHGEGENIELVEICALGSCATTDAAGQWGFVVESDFAGGDVLFTVVGHGINAQVVEHLPADATEIFLHLQHESGSVIVHHKEVDSVSVAAPEDHEHTEADSHAETAHAH